MTPMHIGVLLVAGFLVSGVPPVMICCNGWLSKSANLPVVPISEPKQFKPESYTKSAVEPFSEKSDQF